MDIKKKLNSIPRTPGVYFFRDKDRHVLYIGKANDLKKRVSSYFRKRYPDPRIQRMAGLITDIDYVPTASNAEALIYEASFIKQFKPRYNIALKDDKSYPFLKLTVKEKYSRLIITREKNRDGSLYFGPYTNAALLRQAVSFMKHVFPLRTCARLPKRACLNYHIGLCLGPCLGDEKDKQYKETVRDIKLFLSGKKKMLIKRLAQRMKRCAQNMEYEEALKIRESINALSVVIDQSRLRKPLDGDLKELKDVLGLRVVPARIEAFDISNIYGTSSVGSMVTFFDARPLKSQYRRYRIKTVKEIDDYSMIREVVRRRYRRLLEEKKNMPDLILIDGGLGHLNTALDELKRIGLGIPIISIAKKKELIYMKGRKGPIMLPRRSKAFKLIQRIRNEAHRFAISYHKLLRKKEMLK